MKVGDLVTISARGCKLRNLYMWKKYVSEHKLIGLLKEIEATAHETRYYVDWFGSDYPTQADFVYADGMDIFIGLILKS